LKLNLRPHECQASSLLPRHIPAPSCSLLDIFFGLTTWYVVPDCHCFCHVL
jgi:hypothetical protein